MSARPLRCLLPALLLALLASTGRAHEITASKPTEEGYDRAKEAMKQVDIALRAFYRTRSPGMGKVMRPEDFEERDRALQRLLEARNEALRVVDEVYGITPPKGLEGEPEARNIDWCAWVVDHGGWRVAFGHEAFGSPDGTLSPGWLAAQKIQAFTHLQQTWDGRHHLWTPEGASAAWKIQEGAINDVEACEAVLREADDLGLSDRERAEFEKQRGERYELVSEENRRSVDEGDYTTDPSKTDPERVRHVTELPPFRPATVTPTPAEPTSGAENEGRKIDFGPLILTFHGTNTTHEAKAKVENPTDEPRVLDLPTGLLLVPEDPSIQTLMTGVTPPVYVPPRSTGWVLVPALCTDRDKDVPPRDIELFGSAPDFAPPGRGSEPAPSPDIPVEEGSRVLPESLHRRLRIVAITTERYLRERYAFFERPTEDPPGPYERANPPDEPMLVNGRLVVNGEPGGDEIRVEPGQPITLTPTPRTVLVRPTEGEPFGLLVPGTEEPEPGPATFADAVRTQTIWALTNGDGKADREQIAEQSRKQFEAQGASEEKAKRAAGIVADEVGDAVDEVIEQAKDLEDEPDLSFKIDATLKGVVAPH